MKPVQFSPPRKRSLTLARHRTSVSLEDAFWEAFQALAKADGVSINALASRIDRQRGLDVGLASAIRLYVLERVQNSAGPEDPSDEN